MTVSEFIAKRRKVELKERSAAQEHFLDLCAVFDHPTPAAADPTGEAFCFEKGAAKHGGGGGFFGWEYKSKHKNLAAAYDQLLCYRSALENPPLLVLCDLDRVMVRTNFTGTVETCYEIQQKAPRTPTISRLCERSSTTPRRSAPAAPAPRSPRTPPPGSVHALTSPSPTIVLQPLRMTDGTVFLGNDDVDTTEHCLGVVWSAGGKIDLFALLDDSHLPFKDDLSFTSDNLTVNGNGELVFPKSKPDELKPAISLVKLHYKPNQSTDLIFDKLWVVVNAPETKTIFDNWYAANADISWTANLPSPFASIAIATNVIGVISPVDPEPNPLDIGGRWHAPEAKDSYLHHDAQFEMRSKPVSGGHGHQAMYDDSGLLITIPIAAGTADLFAPYNSLDWPYPDADHREQDVYPFIRALQLDGNPAHPKSKKIPANLTRPCIYKGPNTDKYFERRPVLP